MINKNSFPEQNKFGISIEDSGYALLDSTWYRENECSPFSRLYFIKGGSGYLKKDGKTIPIKGGFVYIVPAECQFSYGCESLEKLYFHISVLTSEKYELLAGIKEIYCLPFSQQEFDNLYECYFSEDYARLLELKSTLYSSVSEFLSLTHFFGVPIKRYSETVEKAMKYIQHNPLISLRAKDISDALFISESKLRKAFKDETGTAVGTYSDTIVFNMAKRMLVENRLSVKDISRVLGFCDQFYFSRSFKSRFGKTPLQYRRDNIRTL